jgi:hypothetical protein
MTPEMLRPWWRLRQANQHRPMAEVDDSLSQYKPSLARDPRWSSRRLDGRFLIDAARHLDVAWQATTGPLGQADRRIDAFRVSSRVLPALAGLPRAAPIALPSPCSTGPN